MDADSEIDKAGLILLLLAAESSKPELRFRCDGITRLEKLLFLVEQETNVQSELDEPFTFEAYHYGPYSKDVYDEVDFLRGMQLLDERRVEVSSGLDLSEEADMLDAEDVSADRYVERRFQLTEDGKNVARVLSTRLSSEGKAQLAGIKKRYGSMPLRQLLRYVYSRYPDYSRRARDARATRLDPAGDTRDRGSTVRASHRHTARAPR